MNWLSLNRFAGRAGEPVADPNSLALLIIHSAIGFWSLDFGASLKIEV
jgi:hypothetical protein